MQSVTNQASRRVPQIRWTEKSFVEAGGLVFFIIISYRFEASQASGVSGKYLY
jgi:hypothetical protein